MIGRISRRKLAGYAARELTAGRPKTEVLRELAAYLQMARRTREAELVVRDIEEILAGQGIVIADVTSAHQLTDNEKSYLKKFLAAPRVDWREHVDAAVLGGVRIETPSSRYDATIKRKLDALKAKQL